MNDVSYHLPEYDMYVAMMLSGYLDKEESPPEPTKEDDIIDLSHNLIWLPADKHPQIAPNEFVKFLQTHGTYTIRRAKSLGRKKSILSQSSTDPRAFLFQFMNDTPDLKDTLILDRHSSQQDTSRIIAPTTKSLSRRSAFSSRNKTTTKIKRRSTTPPAIPWNKSEGIDLVDQPVNMGELIDLGTTTPIPLMSRVHEAETHRPPKKPKWKQVMSSLIRSLSLKPKVPEPIIKIPTEIVLYNSQRLPLHVERAIYRLSHIKLADPRRPLSQQVLISNLMFWYLSIQPIVDVKKRPKIGFLGSKKRKSDEDEDDIPLSHYR
ncbi:activator of mitotic machinery Cdc14 phosphatase activation C-term-domain-containing protein [Pilobolus umbonatus]|nr:activator of mitotic machinery Cdc14 phosphatase activation C-term-domain-containing protein [Pilobolus umbonatus]